MTTCCLDTSIAVPIILDDPDAVAWFERTIDDVATTVVASRLLQTELTRVLRREGLPVTDRGYILDRISIAPLTESVLTSAEAIVPHVTSLDAIHLATALALGSATIVITHDANVKRVAEELGLHAFDPLE